MPRYDYICSVCGMTTEVEKSFGDDTLPTCCENSSMMRKWSSNAVHFKGSGFYSTDSK